MSAEGQNALTVRPRELRPQLKRDKLDASRILVVTKPSVVATPSPEINSVLEELLSRVRAILGRCFVGMYLDGSLAIGDFEPDKSDLDFVVVTDGELSAETFRDLKTMHEDIAAGASKWAKELEGSYIPQSVLRHDRRPAAHPYIDRGSTLAIVHQESGYWIIHRHVLREHGVVLAGPPPRTLIDPVQPSELREAVLGILREWWVPMLVDAPLLQNSFYRCYAVLTMARMLYTIRHGAIVSKLVAARWAEEALDRRWSPLIRDALAWTRDVPPDLNETLAYIRYTCDYDDHNPPHFHAEYGEHEVLVSISTLAILSGSLPARALGLVTEWASLHLPAARPQGSRRSPGRARAGAGATDRSDRSVLVPTPLRPAQGA